jgi:DNA-binding MarR family transcriptional regulator
MHVRSLTDRQFRSLAEFRYQIRRFLHFSEREYRAFSLQPQHYQLLVALKGLPPGMAPTIGNLAERLQLEHHSLVELLDRASQQGLVARRREFGDRRRVGIHLTAKGERFVDQLAARHVAELQSSGRPLVTALRPLLVPARSKAKA